MYGKGRWREWRAHNYLSLMPLALHCRKRSATRVSAFAHAVGVRAVAPIASSRGPFLHHSSRCCKSYTTTTRDGTMLQ